MFSYSVVFGKKIKISEGRESSCHAVEKVCLNGAHRILSIGCCTHVKTRKLLQICKQVVTRLLSNRYQDMFALLVPSCCDKSGTSCYHLVTRLITVTDLLQSLFQQE